MSTHSALYEFCFSKRLLYTFDTALLFFKKQDHIWKDTFALGVNESKR